MEHKIWACVDALSQLGGKVRVFSGLFVSHAVSTMQYVSFPLSLFWLPPKIGSCIFHPPEDWERKKKATFCCCCCLFSLVVPEAMQYSEQLLSSFHAFFFFTKNQIYRCQCSEDVRELCWFCPPSVRASWAQDSISAKHEAISFSSADLVIRWDSSFVHCGLVTHWDPLHIRCGLWSYLVLLLLQLLVPRWTLALLHHCPCWGLLTGMLQPPAQPTTLRPCGKVPVSEGTACGADVPWNIMCNALLPG